MAVFRPNLTSKLIVQCVQALGPGPDTRWAEIGCGSGWISATLARTTQLRLGRARPSDISVEAIEAAKANLKGEAEQPEYVVAEGARNLLPASLDLVVCDVAAISSLYCDAYEWYRGVPSGCGVDGLDNLRGLIPDAHQALAHDGMFVVPVLSLADSSTLVRLLEQQFSRVSVTLPREWPLPPEPVLTASFDDELMSCGLASPESRYGKRLAWTSVAICEP